MKIYAIDNGKVSMHLKSPNFNNNLPIIPSELTCVNFTWRSGAKRYYYHFDRLQSLDESMLKPPTVSIRIKGKVPQEAKGLFTFYFVSIEIFQQIASFVEFSVFLPCKDNSSGIAMFSIGLLITSRGKPIPGTPLRLNLRKECAQRGVYDRASLSTFMQGMLQSVSIFSHWIFSTQKKNNKELTQ